MKIHQLQAIYLCEQDRILVRLNSPAGEELRLWLTRRMVKNLFPHMIEASIELVTAQTELASHDGASRRELMQFKKQEALLQADFSTPFDTQASVLPIGVEPLLATSVHVSPLEDGSLRIGFEEKIPGVAGSRSFEVTLGQQLLHGFLHLLETALQHSDWGMTLGASEKLKDAQSMDVFAAAEMPRYLN
jgi:hypothetical protein